MGSLFRSGQHGNLLGNVQAIALQRDHFSRVIGENTQIFQSKIDQDLRADSALMLELAFSRDVLPKLVSRVIQDVGQRAGCAERRRRGVDSESSSCMVKVDKHATVRGSDGFQ